MIAVRNSHRRALNSNSCRQALKCRSSSPSPDSFLPKVVHSEGISLANKEILEVEDNCHMPNGKASKSGHSRGPYEHFTTNEKVK